MLRKVMHPIYFLAGCIICSLCLIWWKLRDRISPPETEAILFVAHPDDDTLFFHSFIREKEPYIVLLFTGWSLKRLFDYFKVMRHYHVRYRAYPTVSNRAYGNLKRRNMTRKHVVSSLKTNDYKIVATHNSSGEYGHGTHKLVNEVVLDVCKTAKYEIYCPVQKDEIENFPLTREQLQDKKYIFDNLYKSEAWVMTDEAAGTVVWFFNEKLENIKYV